MIHNLLPSILHIFGLYVNVAKITANVQGLQFFGWMELVSTKKELFNTALKFHCFYFMCQSVIVCSLVSKSKSVWDTNFPMQAYNVLICQNEYFQSHTGFLTPYFMLSTSLIDMKRYISDNLPAQPGYDVSCFFSSEKKGNFFTTL